MVRNYKRKTEDRWTKQDLLNALMCIKDSQLKINDAARTFGISRATLYRQYQKFLQAGGKYDVNQFRTCGGNPILTKVEEDVLEKTVIDLRDQGFSVTSSDIKRICFEYCDSNGIPNQFNVDKRMASDDWYYGFLKRHPNVRNLNKPASTDTNINPGDVIMLNPSRHRGGKGRNRRRSRTSSSRSTGRKKVVAKTLRGQPVKMNRDIKSRAKSPPKLPMKTPVTKSRETGRKTSGVSSRKSSPQPKKTSSRGSSTQSTKTSNLDDLFDFLLDDSTNNTTEEIYEKSDSEDDSDAGSEQAGSEQEEEQTVGESEEESEEDDDDVTSGTEETVKTHQEEEEEEEEEEEDEVEVNGQAEASEESSSSSSSEEEEESDADSEEDEGSPGVEKTPSPPLLTRELDQTEEEEADSEECDSDEDIETQGDSEDDVEAQKTSVENADDEESEEEDEEDGDSESESGDGGVVTIEDREVEEEEEEEESEESEDNEHSAPISPPPRKRSYKTTLKEEAKRQTRAKKSYPVYQEIDEFEEEEVEEEEEEEKDLRKEVVVKKPKRMPNENRRECSSCGREEGRSRGRWPSKWIHCLKCSLWYHQNCVGVHGKYKFCCDNCT